MSDQTEEKRMSHDEAEEVKADMPVVGMGATSFAELDAVEQAQEAVAQVRKRTTQFPALVENILQDPDIEDKESAFSGLAQEFAVMATEAMTKERWQPLTNAVVKALAPLLGKKDKDPLPPEPEPENKQSFLLYKQADGSYRWMAIYSNKFRDRDNPPEIISEASHLNFVKQVNAGELPYPELWLWHIDGSRWGVADFVGYDDNGFAVASGTVDKGKEWIAETLQLSDNLLVSHGMPKDSIARSAEDPTVIERHETKEISPLPANVAANEYTGFSILDSEVKSMALNEQDKAKLTELGIDPERVEAETASKATETEGLEYKETEPPEAEKTEAGDFVSRDEVAELVKSIADSTNQMVEVVGSLVKRVEKLETGKAELDRKTIEETPAASLADLYKSVVGAPETKVDGRSALAKSGPTETPPQQVGFGLDGGLGAVIARRNQEIERGGVQ